MDKIAEIEDIIGRHLDRNRRLSMTSLHEVAKEINALLTAVEVTGTKNQRSWLPRRARQRA